MKLVRFIFIFLITLTCTVALNVRINGIPPLGKFLDPIDGFWQNSEYPEDIPTHILASQLHAPAQVKYDEYLIPHIFAQNEEDLYFVQGYVVASHRLWQMETQTMVSAGRLSEIMGEDLLEFDRFNRRRGLAYGAKNSLKAMQKDTALYRLLERFSEGVNAYIETLDYGELPVEYKLLNYWPERWSPYKTALLLKYMASDLSIGEKDLENTNFLRLYGKNLFDRLYPNRNAGDVPIIPKGARWNFNPVDIQTGDPQYFERFIAEAYARPDPNNGSNNWAVNGSMTSSGNAILCNDLHLGLNLPSPWYLMQLSSPEMNVFGATIPGALGIVVGFNDSIAWGMTNAKQDVADWYKISFRDDEKKEYKYDDKWLKTQQAIERYHVRGRETFVDTVYYTHYGPIVFDEHFNPDDRFSQYALRWTGHDESLEQKTFYELNKGRNYEDYVEALTHYDCPAQNFIFASADNEIAITVNGKFPVKWPEQGKFLMDGANSSHEWQAYIPREHLPRSYNPARGFLFSANQYPVDSLYPYYIYDYNYEDFRNRRIYDRLMTMDKVTVQNMMSLQNDNFNYKAYLSLPLLLDQIDTTTFAEQETEIYNLLSEWDYFNHVNLKAPSVYETWWHFLNERLWSELDSDTIILSKPEPYNTIQVLQNDPAAIFSQLKSTDETLTDVARRSFAQAIDSLQRWSETTQWEYFWGDYKGTRLRHLLRLSSFSYENIPIGGDKNIVNANGKDHGVSFRIITEMGPSVKSWLVYAGGQSGKPGSPFYGNFIDMWREGRYIEALFLHSPDEKPEHILLTQNFQP